jgi:hypothetical protein
VIDAVGIGANLLTPVLAGRYALRFTSGALEGQIRAITPLPVWTANKYYEQNQIINAGNGHQYLATTAGTSGASAPTWPTTPGGTVVDSGVTWEEYGKPGVNGVTWAGSTATPAAVGDYYDILRASSFTDIFRYVKEYELTQRSRRFYENHN